MDTILTAEGVTQAARRTQAQADALRSGDIAVLTFNQPVVAQLESLCAAQPVA